LVELPENSKTSSGLTSFPWYIDWCADTNNHYLKDFQSEV